ncbi:MFS transporter [Myceligenerans xiligouense]|uniref:Putative MFS family arabinose efflux permease n=1 Tax=Myceligenerans xiligouense TaxID=253184 RepID=A0A3N4YUP8_9MICO|nr:MFS transporter [Myceligenerans xiligouense]RPF22310.1 putative MFS family arabinose efflux permease [Myceligenerans xiligouense]
MTSSPSRGALGFWSELPRDGRWLLSTVVVNTFGRGLTLPFTIIYLHEVRGFSLDLAGTLMGLIAVAGLIVTGPAGVLIDRFGARSTLLAGMACAIAGQTILAFATVPWAAGVGLALFGAQFGVAWPANNALISTVVHGDLRQRYFGVNFALVNLGIGVGGVFGGLLVDVERPVTFVVAFLVNAATFAAPVAVLLGPLRHLRPRDEGAVTSGASGAGERGAGASGVAGRAGANGAATGYLAILRRPEVAWLTALAALAAFAGYGQLESGFPAYARQVAEVSTRAVGFAFVVNTAVIVLLQFWVMERARGHRRTRVLALFGLIWSGSWLVLGVSGLMPGTAGSVAVVLGFMGVFAVGEALLQSALPALTNDLAPDHLRGRYNALSSAAFQVGTIAGPVTAGVLLDRGHPALFIGMLAAVCAGITVTAFVLGRRVSPDVDGVRGADGAPRADGTAHVRSGEVAST